MTYKIYGLDVTDAVEAGALKPISIDITTGATTDSTELCNDGEFLNSYVLEIDTAYTAGTMTTSIYHASGSEALDTNVDLTAFAAGDIIHFPVGKLNSSGQNGVFRAELTGAATGAATLTLDRRYAPAS